MKTNKTNNTSENTKNVNNVEVKQMERASVEKLIREAAASKLAGKYSLPCYKSENGSKHAEYMAVLVHKQICAEVVKFMAEHGEIPLYTILSVGISKGAYKTKAFEKGYREFNPTKVLQVWAMGNAYNEHHNRGGRKGKLSDVAWRLMMRYWETKSPNIDDFMKDLKNCPPLGKACGERGHYGKLCRMLGLLEPTNSPKETETDAA